MRDAFRKLLASRAARKYHHPNLSTGRLMLDLRNPWRALPPRARLLVVLGLALAWEPAAAQAACGDHVRIRGQVGVGQDSTEPAGPMPAPCRGPHCSRQGAPPLVPPSSAPRAASSSDLHPGLPTALPAACPSPDVLCVAPLNLPPVPVARIFHPPR